MQLPALVSIYKLNCPPPDEQFVLLQDSNRLVTITHGSITVKSGKFVPSYTDEGTAATMQIVTHTVPQGTYLVIETPVALIPGEGRSRASIMAKEIAAAVEATQPNFILEKSLEEVANPPNGVVATGEGPGRLTSIGKVQPAELAEPIRETIQFIDSMPDPEMRRRFRLCSRWFWRGHETTNQIDRFLSFFVALEVYPALGAAEVPNSLRDRLQSTIFYDLKPGEVKERLELGQMAGLRAEIVHGGLSLLSESKLEKPDSLLEKLEAVLRVILRQMAGRDYDGSLDRWVRPDA